LRISQLVVGVAYFFSPFPAFGFVGTLGDQSMSNSTTDRRRADACIKSHSVFFSALP
jgi:hypothetical protein